MAQEFTGKVAVVTGAGSGIGCATALLLGRLGAKVHTADVNERSARVVCADIDAAGGHAVAHHVDVSDPASVEALANAVLHGNQNIEDKRVLVRAYCDPGQGFLIVVRDEGPGFDPDRVPDPRRQDRRELSHGRGIFLMRELMDHVEHRKGGREVILVKRFPVSRP